MSNKKKEEKMLLTPVENHETAAWANIKKTKSQSQVSVPSDLDMEFAKEWVDKNQK